MILASYRDSKDYTDQEWAIRVGVFVLVVMLIQSVSYIFEFLFIFMAFKFRKLICTKHKEIQGDLNKIMCGPQMDTSVKYGSHVAFIMMTLIYLPITPLSLPALFIYLTVSYIGDKFLSNRIFLILLVLRYHKRQDDFNSTEAFRLSVYGIYFAIILHCLMAIQIFGSGDIFPKDYEGIKTSKGGQTITLYKGEEVIYIKKVVKTTYYCR
jgi:hypothetical protein